MRRPRQAGETGPRKWKLESVADRAFAEELRAFAPRTELAMAVRRKHDHAEPGRELAAVPTLPRSPIWANAGRDNLWSEGNDVAH